jgi:hypothetical protein
MPAPCSKATQAIEPLSAARYKVQLTASSELRAKLERATELMRHRNPTGDLAVIVERALDLLLANLERERLGKTARPVKNPRPAKARHVTQSARRETFARDGEQCSFVGDAGERCPARGFLEVDHVQPRARGGSSKEVNLRVLCRAHNRYVAESAFGRDHIARQIHSSQQKSRPAATAAVPLGSAGGDAREQSTLALVKMGFKALDARRAVGDVMSRHEGGDAVTDCIASILRDALAVLTRR